MPHDQPIPCAQFVEANELPPNAYSGTGVGHCFVAGRLSYTLGLHGACEAVDVACSSALVACHGARHALQLGDASDALVAGVNMMFLPATLDNYAAAGLTSRSGKPHVFDARATGFVRGEGVGAVALHRADAAPSPLFAPLLALCGSAVRHDGRSASLTAPNGRAQQRLLGAMLSNAGTLPSQLQLMEAAANGSPLGDPIEMGAVAAAVLVPRAAVPRPTNSLPLAVGSVKANTGHTESASGMIGLAKLLGCMLRSLTTPNAQLAVLAPHVIMACPQSAAPCAFATQLAPAPAELLQGTVCSFGLGGTLAGIVLQHCPAGTSTRLARGVTFRRRYFAWRRPLRVHVAQVGSLSGLVLSEQPAYSSAPGQNELELQVAHARSTAQPPHVSDHGGQLSNSPSCVPLRRCVRWASISAMSSLCSGSIREPLNRQAVIVRRW